MGEDALARFRRGRVGIVFQSFHLIPTMTALENVAVPLELMRRARTPSTRAEARTCAPWAWSCAPIIIPDNCPAASSSAWRWPAPWRRGPQILFADEPTGNLDSATGAGIADLLFALNARARRHPVPGHA